MSTRIKVAHIITKLELGGAQQNTLYTVSHLDRAAFEPILISGTGGILDDDARKLDGVRAFFVPDLIRAINPIKDFRAFIALWRILRAEKPQIVHTHSSKAGILGRWAAFFARVPVIIHTFHGYGFHDFQSLPVKWMYIFLEFISAPIADKLIVVTNEDIAKGLRYFIGSKDKYQVIRSGIDTKKYAMPANCTAIRAELEISAGVPVITTIGPFKPQKNLPDFIRVAALVKKHVPSALFLIVGDGSGRPELESLIRDNGLTGSVSLLGWRRDIDRILAASDLFVMTSLWEGLPRAILEAMCTGLPVVANAVDGVKEIIVDGETGYLIEPRAVATMADRIVSLFKAPDACLRFGEAGKQRISEQFDINFMVIQQERLYTDLM